MFTLGIATYDDYDGLYFTVQAARMYHPEITEIVIIDNKPDSNHGKFNKDLTGWQTPKCKLKYVPYTEKTSSFNKEQAFKYATNEYVIICDSHVLLFPESVKALKHFYLNHHKPYDFVQGPLIYDDCKTYSTHLDLVWRTYFYGIWATKQTDEKFFEIPAMGMGCFSCKKNEWLGFNPLFKGFGGEEVYIHEKYRKNGGRCICLQDFKWMHRFGRPNGVNFPNILEDRLSNYLIGKWELELPVQDAIDHFAKQGFSKDIIQKVYIDSYRIFFKRDPEKAITFSDQESLQNN